MLSKGARWEECRLCLGHNLRKWFQDNLLLWWLAEHSPRDSDLFLVHQTPVKNTLVFAVAQNLYGVTNMHDDGVWNAFGGDPFALVEKLQAGHHVVEDESQCAYVRVGFDTKSKFGLRANGIVVDFHLQKKFFKAADFLL